MCIRLVNPSLLQWKLSDTHIDTKGFVRETAEVGLD